MAYQNALADLLSAIQQAWEPPDDTGRYNTALKPAQEARFRAQYAPNDSYDYDMRGAYAANTKAAANGHYPDTYKKPNHMTFSTGSQYSTPEHTGGQWIQAPSGKWIFMASPWNMNNSGALGLLDYFAHQEQGNIPVLPIDWSLRR